MPSASMHEHMNCWNQYLPGTVESIGQCCARVAVLRVFEYGFYIETMIHVHETSVLRRSGQS